MCVYFPTLFRIKHTVRCQKGTHLNTSKPLEEIHYKLFLSRSQIWEISSCKLYLCWDENYIKVKGGGFRIWHYFSRQIIIILKKSSLFILNGVSVTVIFLVKLSAVVDSLFPPLVASGTWVSFFPPVDNRYMWIYVIAVPYILHFLNS